MCLMENFQTENEQHIYLPSWWWLSHKLLLTRTYIRLSRYTHRKIQAMNNLALRPWTNNVYVYNTRGCKSKFKVSNENGLMSLIKFLDYLINLIIHLIWIINDLINDGVIHRQDWTLCYQYYFSNCENQWLFQGIVVIVNTFTASILSS